MNEQTGIQPFISEENIKYYLDEVLSEIDLKRHNDFDKDNT